MGLQEAVIEADGNRCFVRRQEMSCKAGPAWSSPPFREPWTNGCEDLVMVTPLCHDGGPRLLGDRRSRRTSGPPHFLQCSGVSGVGCGS
jgi:hypothetical protein